MSAPTRLHSVAPSLLLSQALLLLHLAQGLLTCALLFPFAGPVWKQRLIRRWSARLLSICGVTVRQRLMPGVSDDQPGLIVCNHVSWLDIFVINARQPCRFVAKSDIRDWPLVGWLCERAGTVFIARGRQRDVRRIYSDLVRTIHAGERVAFFPEGTTAPNLTVLPFHANLFEAAIEAQVPVHPYAVRYLDPSGEPHAAAEFIGDTTFGQSITRVLRARNLTAELILLPPLETAAAHRRDLAEASRNAIAAALGLQSEVSAVSKAAADIVDTESETGSDPAA